MGKIFYILFDTNSELDYMFQGLFTSYDDAFNTFHQRLLDNEDNDEEEIDEDINSSNITRENAEKILDKWNWKIIETELDKYKDIGKLYQ